VRLCSPPPHDLVHVVQAVNEDTAQCTAHGPMLQSTTSVGRGHDAPPFCGAVSERERDFVPPPHVFVQVLKLPHVPMTQSTGHAWLLQSFMSLSTGQEPPPFWAAIKVRVRDCVPPPHDTLHVL
jgi:hypothetical protein